MAARFWVGGTGTWDGSDTTHWASSSGGAGGQSVPGSSDDVTFDGSSGGGTVTVNTNASILSLTTGAFTGTITWATNNNDLTIGGQWSNSGSGTRTITMGSGTVTFTATSGTIGNFATITGLTYNAGTGKHLIAATPTGERTFTGGGTSLTFNKIEIDDGGNVGHCNLIIVNTRCADFVPTDVRTLAISSGSTFTVNNSFTWNGTLARPSRLMSTSLTTGVGTFSVAGTVTGQYLAVSNITKSGAGSITFTNSFDMGGNTSVTITAPAGTSAGGGGIIGG